MRKNSGFTLMELMVVIAIVAILASLSVNQFIKWLPKYRAKKAAMELSGQLHKVKLQAVRENRQLGVYFDANTDRYHVLGDDGTNNSWDGPTVVGGDDPSERFIDLPSYGSGVRFDTLSPGMNGYPLVVFRSQGTCSHSVQVEVTNIGGDPKYLIQTTVAGAILLDRL